MFGLLEFNCICGYMFSLPEFNGICGYMFGLPEFNCICVYMFGLPEFNCICDYMFGLPEFNCICGYMFGYQSSTVSTNIDGAYHKQRVFVVYCISMFVLFWEHINSFFPLNTARSLLKCVTLYYFPLQINLMLAYCLTVYTHVHQFWYGLLKTRYETYYWDATSQISTLYLHPSND